MPPTARSHQALHACLKPLSRSIALAFAAAACATSPMPSRANPQGGVVVGGAASISQPSPALITVLQQTPNAIINWQSFSIGSGEAVRFNQPSPTSAVLNRVVGNDPSSILGTLSANGRVYLVNQNGVFVGPGAQIDASSLVLSTANVSNDDFMAGRLNFNQPGKPDAKIVNEGRLTARDGGLVALVAPGVENRGVISAKLGQVVLAGAPAFSLDLLGDGMVNVLLTPQSLQSITDAAGKPLSNYVDTAGQISAEGGRIWIAAAQAKGIVDSMVHVGGELRATRVEQKGGEITLLGGDELRVAGSVLATNAGGKGGSIAASADRVTLASNAVLDASGSVQGGSVLVGGAFQGQAPVRGAGATARQVVVDAGAVLRADAIGAKGDGGTVVLWSEESTQFAGAVSARGGREGGNGGLIEVSGKKALAFDGQADGSAPAGTAGTLLLDPGSLTVADAGSGGWTASGADSTVAASSISATLRGGTTVNLRADDDITISAQVDGRARAEGETVTPGAGLDLTAGRTITVNKSIVLNDGDFSAKAGSFSQAAGTVIATVGAGGSIGAGSIAIQAVGDVRTENLLTTGSVALSSTGGSVFAAQAIGGQDQRGNGLPVGKLNIDAAKGKVTLAQGARSADGMTIGAGDLVAGSLYSGGALNVSAIRVTQLGDIQSGAGVDLTTTDATRALALSGIDANGAVTVNGAGAVTLYRDKTILSRTGNVAITAGASIDAQGTLAANTLMQIAQGAAYGSIALNSVGDISVNQLVAAGSATLTSTKGAVTLRESVGGNDAGRPTVGALRLVAFGDVTTNGLNLAGRASGDGLSMIAGVGSTSRADVIVNERVGVARGNVYIETASSESKSRIMLFGGVFGRDDQNIDMNGVIAADGGNILASWRKVPVGTVSKSDSELLLANSLAIPVEYDRNPSSPDVDPTSPARELAGGGKAIRVQYVNVDGKPQIVQICDFSAIACGTGLEDRWLIPTVTISNQDHVTPNVEGSAGKVYIRKGYEEPTTAALTFEVGASSAEIGGKTDNSCAPPCPSHFIENAQYNRVNSTNGGGSFSPRFDNLLVANNPPSIEVEIIQVEADELIQYSGGLAYAKDVGGAAISNLPLSISVFGGVLMRGVDGSNSDAAHVVPGTGGNAYGSSDPSRFAPVNIGGGSLTNAVLAGLPPAPPATGSPPPPPPSSDNSSATLTAAASNAASSSTQRARSTCAEAAHVVVGRSRGDEADVGSASALRGAPRAALKTVYAVGDVADGLPAVDRDAIRGTSDSGGVDCL